MCVHRLERGRRCELLYAEQKQRAKTLKRRGDKADLFRPGTKGEAGGNGSKTEEGVGGMLGKRFFGKRPGWKRGRRQGWAREEGRRAQEMCAV